MENISHQPAVVVSSEDTRAAMAKPLKGVFIRLEEDLHARIKAKAALRRISISEYWTRLAEQDQLTNPIG